MSHVDFRNNLWNTISLLALIFLLQRTESLNNQVFHTATGCYGSRRAVPLKCDHGQAIAFRTAMYGRKPEPICKFRTADKYYHHCCGFNQSDCLMKYTAKDRRSLYEACSTKQQCRHVAASRNIVSERFTCKTVRGENRTNYAAFKYYCIPASAIQKFCQTKKTTKNGVIYLMYPRMEGSNDKKGLQCSCSVTAVNATLEVRVVDIRFNRNLQALRIFNGTKLKVWRYKFKGGFKIIDTSSTGTLRIHIKNKDRRGIDMIWMQVTANTAAQEINTSCFSDDDLAKHAYHPSTLWPTRAYSTPTEISTIVTSSVSGSSVPIMKTSSTTNIQRPNRISVNVIRGDISPDSSEISSLGSENITQVPVSSRSLLHPTTKVFKRKLPTVDTATDIDSRENRDKAGDYEAVAGASVVGLLVLLIAITSLMFWRRNRKGKIRKGKSAILSPNAIVFKVNPDNTTQNNATTTSVSPNQLEGVPSREGNEKHDVMIVDMTSKNASQDNGLSDVKVNEITHKSISVYVND